MSSRITTEKWISHPDMKVILMYIIINHLFMVNTTDHHLGNSVHGEEGHHDLEKKVPASAVGNEIYTHHKMYSIINCKMKLFNCR
jgi:hypothetical protein